VHSKYVSVFVATGIYVVIVAVVSYYFGYHAERTAPHYVARNSSAISVTLHNPSRPIATPKKRAKPTTRPKRAHAKPKHAKPKALHKTARPKSGAKPTKRHKVHPKKVRPKKLFSGISSSPKQPKKRVSSPTKTRKTPGKTGNKKGKTPHDKGVENRYLAQVQERLYGWPSQSNFAGASIMIGLHIHPDGRFDYVVLTPSDNPDFQRTIIRYLDQLESIGFDPTPTGKPYKFQVEIVAK
jgi:hypothetical protein